MVQSLVGLITIVALSASALTVMTTQSLSVVERRKEIGRFLRLVQIQRHGHARSEELGSARLDDEPESGNDRGGEQNEKKKLQVPVRQPARRERGGSIARPVRCGAAGYCHELARLN
jgi:hypothetical protein